MEKSNPVKYSTFLPPPIVVERDLLGAAVSGQRHRPLRHGADIRSRPIQKRHVADQSAQAAPSSG